MRLEGRHCRLFPIIGSRRPLRIPRGSTSAGYRRRGISARPELDDAATKTGPRRPRGTAPRALKPFLAPAPARGEVNRTMQLFRSTVAHARRDDGQTMAEYGVVLAVVTLLVVAALTALSGGISSAIDAVTGIL